MHICIKVFKHRMDWRSLKFDWNRARAFLVTVEEGSLSAAARALGVSQPTLGRQVSALEQELGVALFERNGQGMQLTPSGHLLVEHVRGMGNAAMGLSLAASGQADTIEGRICISASEATAMMVLPGLIKKLKQLHPAMVVDLIASNETSDLKRREADIAIRMYRSDQLDVVTRQIGSLPIGVYAARRYLNRAGQPDTIQDLKHHDLVGFDRSELILRGMRQMGLEVTQDDFALRCDDQLTYWELVRAGCGIGFTQRAVGIADPLVEELKFDVEIPPLDVWLAAHQAMRQTPRIRRVWDMLAEGLHYSQLNLQC